MSVVQQHFGARATLPGTHPLSAYLCELMATKKTNLCLSADVRSASALLKVAEEVGEHICVLKTHSDMIDDFGERTIKKLKEISRRKKFLLFEDRKFGDIGSTVQAQYTGGPSRIAEWAHIVNAHVFPGEAIITALSKAAETAVSKLSRSVSTEVYAGTPVVSDHEFGDGDDDDDGDERRNAAASGGGSRGGIMGVNSSANDKEGGKQGNITMTTASRHSGEAGTFKANSPVNHRKGSIVTTTHIYQTVEPREGHRSPKRMRSPPSENAGVGVSGVTGGGSGGGGAAAAAGGNDEDDEDDDNVPEPPMRRGLLLLAQMSSEGNLMDKAYTEQAVAWARKHSDFVMGFISQENLNGAKEDNFLCMTPGVSLPAEGAEEVKGDGLGQQYRTPEKVVKAEGVDIVIVGRGILKAADRAKEAKRYRDAAWKAYLARIKA